MNISIHNVTELRAIARRYNNFWLISFASETGNASASVDYYFKEQTAFEAARWALGVFDVVDCTSK